MPSLCPYARRTAVTGSAQRHAEPVREGPRGGEGFRPVGHLPPRRRARPPGRPIGFMDTTTPTRVVVTGAGTGTKAEYVRT
ncbi:hypothetical protein [Streptomyces sp. cmx-4-25]|uniref:hypothetical protein n=1 Tax=Streptomyces sp. cmx-4-25 TaxID=2790933 RepID=UPI00397F672F